MVCSYSQFCREKRLEKVVFTKNAGSEDGRRKTEVRSSVGYSVWGCFGVFKYFSNKLIFGEEVASSIVFELGCGGYFEAFVFICEPVVTSELVPEGQLVHHKIIPGTHVDVEDLLFHPVQIVAFSKGHIRLDIIPLWHQEIDKANLCHRYDQLLAKQVLRWNDDQQIDVGFGFDAWNGGAADMLDQLGGKC